MATSESHKEIPLTEGKKKTSTTMQGVVAGLLQEFKPLKNHDMLFNELYCYASDPKLRQVEGNLYSGHLTEDLRQCPIYDSHDSKSARLIGVEYIISREQFLNLPNEEKGYWHSHRYAVSSGLLIMPGVPEMLEDGEMRKLGDTYGKTWLFWQVDRGDPLPYGDPQLMASFTDDQQVNQQLLKLRDEKFKIDSTKKRHHRMQKYADQFLPVFPEADQMLKGEWKGGEEMSSSQPSQYQSSQIHITESKEEKYIKGGLAGTSSQSS